MSNENEPNKSTVTSYRVKEDTKADIKRQLDSLGLTQEEYFKKVVSLMELENVKKNNIFAVNTDELQEITQRIYNIFINVCEQGNSFLGAKDSELQELKEKYKNMLLIKDNIITEQKQELQDVYTKINVLQKTNDSNKLELANIRLKNDKQMEQLESNLKDKTLIVEEYKQKNDMLLSNLAEYKEYKEQYQVIEKELEQVKKDNNRLSTDKINLENTIIKLQDKINNDTERILFHKAEIENKNQSIKEYKADIKTLEEKKDNEIISIKIENKEVLGRELKLLEDGYNKESNKKDLEIEKLNNKIDKMRLRKFKLVNKSRIDKDK